MTLFGLIGYPLGHSFSKKYFTEKFEKEKVVGFRYNLFPIQSIDELPELISNNPDLKGFNITIPYKKDVFAYLDDTSNLPEGLNACNCVRIQNGKLIGYNTDVTGFRLSLRPLLKPVHTNALILGNGGATAAVKHALTLSGISYSVVSRTRGDHADLVYGDLNADVMNRYRLIINTTPLGTYPATSSYPDIPYDLITKDHLLYDLVYNPPLTEFLRKGQERGAVVKNGYDMLVIQAEESWKIWQQI
ncbi:MAG: shikimate dehydrogenase [Chitinophagaceae bacterium]|nr:MAG: shikimate dehydrogenase [Chitinophagaceae bacterium]